MTGCGGRRFWAALLFGMAVLSVLTVVFFAGSSRAADYAPPSLTAWQRLHEGHLTIEWSETARVQQKIDGDRLILRFAKPLVVTTMSAFRNLSNFVDADRTTIEGADLSLVLKSGVSAKVSVREKRIVTVDFSRDPASRPSSGIKASTIDNGIRLTLDWPGPTRVKLRQNINELGLDVYPAWDLDSSELTDLQRSLRPWINGLRSEKRRDHTTLAFTLEPQIASSIRPEGAARTIIDLTRDALKSKALTVRPAAHVFIPERRPSASTAADAGTIARGPPVPRKRPVPTKALASVNDVPATTAKADTDLTEALVIAWDKPVAAAVFIRAGHLFAVFDEEDSDALSAFPVSPAAFGPGSLIPADGGIALRFPLDEPVDIGVSQTSVGEWRIEPLSSPSEPWPLRVERAAGSTGLRVTPVSGDRIVSIIDPSVGDRIDVLPQREPGFGQPSRRRFVDLELLPTMQGLAWRSLSDQLVAGVDENGLLFSSPGGLSLSMATADASQLEEPVIIEAMAKKKPDNEDVNRGPVQPPAVKPQVTEPDSQEGAPPPASYFDLAGSGVERSLVGEYRRIRRQAISKAAPEERDRARLDLARLLVSERLASEARTVLNTISDDAESDVVLQRQALRGVVAFLIGQRAEASTLLLSPALSNDEEIDVWRAALEAAEAKWLAAAERWRAANAILDIYPPRLKLDLGLLAVETAIETDDEKMLRRGLRRLTTLSLDAYDKARLDAMKALKAERSGDLEKARALLTDLAESPHPAIRTLADFQLAALDLEANVGNPDALAALDGRLPLWRGHPQERSMLDQLARRLKDANALRKALNTWRRLIRLYPDAAKDESLQMERQGTYVQALANSTEPAIDPLEVYAIYLDFIDLLPDDPEARDVQRHLARHLIDLDLLDPAIGALQSLMTSTDDGLERVELATEVALLMLHQDRPAQALSLLDDIGKDGGSLPLVLDEQRRLARARALAELDRSDEALRTLRDQRSKPAQRLRAEILWSERRWPRLAVAIETYFDDADKTVPVTEKDQELVLWLALARQREGASAELEALQDRFGDAMRGGAHAEAFAIALQRDLRTDDINALLAKTESQLAELRRFRQAPRVIP